MRILITGKNGQVGSELARLYKSQIDVHLVGREECDLRDEQGLRSLVRRVQPTVIVNPAAYTAVDKAEEDRDTCHAINAVAPGILAEEAARLGALFVHYSTDYVFDGSKPEPYRETDPVCPVSVYGKSKSEGESAVAAAGGRYLVLRTSWVYAAEGKNFLRTMLRLGADRSQLRVVDDQMGAPTAAAAIAEATVRLVNQDAGSPLTPGVYHMTAGGSTSWCGFAREIFATGLVSKPVEVLPISTAEYPTPARRPANSVLSNEKFASTFGFRLPGWRQQLETVVDQLTPQSLPTK